MDNIWPEKSKGACDFHENEILLYTKPKFGKSTLASQFPNPLFFDTEGGLTHLVVNSWHIKTWLEFTYRIKHISDNIKDCPFQTIVIDTVDYLADMCEQYICDIIGKKDNKSYGQILEIPYGRGTKAAKKEWAKQILSLKNLGLGILYIAHDERRTIDAQYLINPYVAGLADEKGNVEMTVPSVDDKRMRKLLLDRSDMILYGDFDKDLRRVLYTKPTKYFEAGDRSNRLPEVVEFSYQALVDAYYSGDGLDGLRDKIKRGEEYLKEKRIKFDRIKIDDTTTASELTRHLQYLRIRGKTGIEGEAMPGSTSNVTWNTVKPKLLDLEQQVYVDPKAIQNARKKYLGSINIDDIGWTEKMQEYWKHVQNKKLEASKKAS